MKSTGSDIVGEKRALREKAMARRDALPEAHRLGAALSIADKGAGFAGFAPGCSVSAYCAIGSEMDPVHLIERLVRQGIGICLPALTPLGQPLQFRSWLPGNELVERKWGLREPAPSAALVEPDVLLVPLLAFDNGCRRLGYGGGYYDRTIARLRALKPVVAVGLAYDEQEVPAVPCEAHDAPLDWVLTASGLRRNGGA